MPTIGLLWSEMPWKDIIPQLARFAYRNARARSYLVMSADVSDIVAEAVEKTLSGARPWDSAERSLFTHLAGVVSSLMCNEQRKVVSRSFVFLDETRWGTLEANSPSPEDELSYKSEVETFTAFIADSNKELLAILRASLQGQNDPRSLAHLLSVPINRIYSQRKRLRELLNDQLQACALS